MNALIAVLTLVICGGAIFLAPAEAPGALAFCIVTSLPTLYFLIRRKEDRTFLLRIFILGILIRIMVGTVIFIGHYEEFFGGDANTYDFYGGSLLAAWHGDKYQLARYQSFVASGASAWGMLYLVAGVYELIGRNMLAVQLINASVGATTSIVVYNTADRLFSNQRVSRLAALLVCFFPSLVLWSSQALKDGIIVLVLALAIFCTLRLLEKITVSHALAMTSCLLILLTLRFYTFYMMAAAVGGSFLIGGKTLDTQAFMRRFAAVVAIGLAFTYFGIVQYAGSQIEKYGSLQVVQLSRQDQARTADSGFLTDVDVQTTSGALTAIPVGIIYLLLAPFPWQFGSLRQSLALPEMVIWWISFPLLVLGLWYGLKYRLRDVSPILIFTTMLTLAYSLVQGNVGTAYRQRSQLLVFYFIFVAVGGVILKERSEDKQRKAKLAKKELAELQAARALARRQKHAQDSQPAVGSS